jgi:hypothetical protein
MTIRNDGDLVSTHQSDYVQRRQSSPYNIHSKSPSLDKSGGGGGAAAGFYNSAESQTGTSTFLNTSGKDQSLSQLDEEEDDYGYKGGHYASSSYGAGIDGDMKSKPYNDAQDASLVKNAAGTGIVKFNDLGM